MIHDNQLKQAIVIEWGKLSQRFIDRAIGQWRRRLEYVFCFNSLIVRWLTS